MKKISLLLIFLLLGIILAAGCTGPAPAASAVPGTPVPATPSVTVQATSAVTVVPLPTGTSGRANPPPDTVTTVTTTRIASDNPYLENLNVRKRTFTYPIPSCLMQNALPAIAKDPLYGIKQVVPKLSVISEDDYIYFLRKNTEGNAENTQLKTFVECQGSVAEPTWNFVEVRYILNPTNIHVSNYTITRNVWSDGKVIAQFPTTLPLVIDSQVTQTTYIPIRTDEIDQIDNVGLTFTRL
jgi:hypothetical protein